MGDPTHFSLRYMQRFACIGSACEESCCSGWQVDVDRPHYTALERAMNDTDAERREFREAHVAKDGKNPHRHARLRLLPNGDCNMLDQHKLCSIQARYGEELLSDTCATYPRSIGAVNGRVELAGQMSCPEVARQALLPKDAMELDAFDPTTMPRLLLHRVQPANETNPYARHLDDVRGTIQRLLSHEEHPLSTRLLLVARFADRTRGFFQQQVNRDFDVAALAHEITTALDPTELATWAERFAALAPSGPRAGFAIAHALAARLDGSTDGRSFRVVLRKVFAEYGFGESERLDIDPALLIDRYRERAATWARHGRRLDEMLSNFSKHYWMKDWYVASPDLLVHAQKLHLRIALQRFLVVGHPELGSPDAPGAEARLERAMVEVAYTFARAMEHDRSFLAQLDGLLPKLELETLAQAIFLVLM